MIDNLATALGQGWVDTATNLLSKLVDISIPLEFNVDIFAYGVNFVQTKPTCDTCTIDSMMNNGPADFGDYSNSSAISYDTDYDLKVAIGVLSYFYVEATPNIDISLELNSVEIWTMELFEFATLENDFVSSNPQTSYLFSHIVDSDNDGVGDSEDFYHWILVNKLILMVMVVVIIKLELMVINSQMIRVNAATKIQMV